MNNQQQHQKWPPQDPNQSLPGRIKIEADGETGVVAKHGSLPPQPPQPAAGPAVQHGFSQPRTSPMSVVPNPLASPGRPKIVKGRPVLARYPPVPGSSAIYSNSKTTLPVASPPIPMPPIPAHDPKEMEERRKKALAYAMSDEITGGAKGRKRHAAKLAAEKKKAAIAAARVKGNSGHAPNQHRPTYAQMPPGSRASYKPGTTAATSLPRSNVAATPSPSSVANPLAPKPPPPNAVNATNTNTSAQYSAMQQVGAASTLENGAGWSRQQQQQQILNSNLPTNQAPKRGRPRKEDSQTAQESTSPHVGFSDTNKLPISLLAEAASNSPSAAVPNDAFAPLPLRRLYDDESLYDPEYARFMRSLMADDQSILTFKTLQSIRSVGDGAEGPPLGTIVGDGSMMGFGTADDDDASYQLTSDEDEEEEDDDDDDNNDDVEEEEKEDEKISAMKVDSPAKGTRSKRKAIELESSASPEETKPQSVDNDDLGNFHEEIEGLMEEDLEAAVASLIGVSPEGEFSSSSWQMGSAPPTGKNAAMAGTEEAQAITTPGQSTRKKKSTATIVTTSTPVGMVPAASESKNAPSTHSRTREPPVVSQEQLVHLRATLARHHQLLLQQATLAVRAAYVQKVVGKPGKPGQNRSAGGVLDKRYCPPNESPCSYQNDFFAGETPEELADCLDGSVSMLQDLEQHWKDAVRNSIQLAFRENTDQTARRRLLHSFGVTRAASSSHDSGTDDNAGNSNQSDENKRLTRSAFTRTLIERELEAEPISGQFKPTSRQRVSVFEIRGLARLRETFTAIDNSVKDIYIARDKKRIKNGINILAPFSHSHACNTLLDHAKADVDPDYVPGQRDLYNILTHAPEAFSDTTNEQESMKVVKCPLTKSQRVELRQNRNQFTAAEDNLILRGVNLYGEKEWVLVSDRFLPDRQVNHIAQRYNRLCFLIYKANGVSIGEKGELPPMPKIGKSGTYNEEKANEIKPAEAPTTMNVHRWTLEEDLAILKAVPVFGSCWADISSKLMPHRDRGHIRKRYQVLERRIPKGVCRVNLKRMFANRSPPAKPPKKLKTSSSTPKTKKPTPTKSTALSHPALPNQQLTTARTSIETPMSPIKSSVQSSGPFSNDNGQQGFGNGTECYSPETKGAAALLGVFSGFSQESQHAEDTRMGVLKILDIADGKMADSNFGEGNFGRGGAPRSPMKSSSDLLEDKIPQGARTSILNSVLDHVRKKGDKNDSHDPIPSKVDFNSYLETTDTPSHTALPGRASPTIPFDLGTPAKGEAKSQSSMDGGEFVRLFMPDNSRQTPLKAALESPIKAGNAIGSNFSPIKLGNMAPPTPITHLGSLGFSGPVDGVNSLFMGASDLDAVAALKDLSNSNPGTPAKEAVPLAASAAAAPREEEVLNERKCKRPNTSFFGRVQANVDRRKLG